MVLKAFGEGMAPPHQLDYIMIGLEQHRYPHLDEARLAFTQVLRAKTEFAKKLHGHQYARYICDRITQIPVAERLYTDHGSEYHGRCAKVQSRDCDSHYGPLLKPGDYQNNKEQFINDRRADGALRTYIYNMSIADIKEAAKDPNSLFMCYFINKDNLVYKHIQPLNWVLRELQERAKDFFWLPLMESPSDEVKNILKEKEIKYVVGYRGLGLKFQKFQSTVAAIRQLNELSSTLSRYLSQAELAVLSRVFWLSQHHPLNPNVPPQLFLPRIKSVDSIIEKMEDYEERYKRKILLSDLTDITGACIAVEDYFSIENVMNLIKATIPRDLVLEEENLYFENKKDRPYRDVKYILRLSHPTMPGPSAHMCYELQIKIIDSKIFHDIDHAAIYKSKLDDDKKEYLRRVFWGQLWIKEKQLLDEYIGLNKEYQKWCDDNKTKQ
ncbi:MAG: hypothetical protein LBJ25_06210 [Candidatus Margulisbacteria bacterium]|jgi:ppGpp synthetase/RelA/SpoT-type nucleotidyltranferase|nr:hypothetical protein [Candidatus Margulisiibacteriota bacterium]